MTVLQKNIIHEIVCTNLPHWLFDHSVVETALGKVHRLGDYFIFVDKATGMPSVADKESVFKLVVSLMYRDVRYPKKVR